jgi:hypothetical protein
VDRFFFMPWDDGTTPAPERWFCLTLVAADIPPPALFEAFGGDAGDLDDSRVREVGQRPPGGSAGGGPVPVAGVGAVGNGTYAFEETSAEGARVEVLQRVSRDASAAAVALAPDDVPRLRWFRDGCLAAEGVLNAPERISGPDAGHLRSVMERSGLVSRMRGYRHREVLSVGVTLAGHLTGLAVSPEQVRQAPLRGLVLPWLDERIPSPGATAPTQATVLVDAADEIAAALGAQCERLVSDYALDTLPGIAEHLDLVRSRSQPQDLNTTPFGVLLRRLASPAHAHLLPPALTEAEPPLRRALQALRSAAVLPLREALLSVYSARSVRPGLLDDLAHDLNYPQPAPSDLHNAGEVRRRVAMNRATALRITKHLDGTAIPLMEGVDAAWNWVLPHLPRGLSFTFAEALTPEQLLARMTAAPSAIEESGPWPPTRPSTGKATAFAGTHQGWAFAVETGTAPVGSHLFTEVSTGTRVVHIQHPGVGPHRFGYAEDGVLITKLDPFLPEQRTGCDPTRFDDTLRRLGVQTEATPATAPTALLALYRLATTILGSPLDELTATHPTHTAPLSWKPSYTRGRPTVVRPYPATPPQEIRAGRAVVTSATGHARRNEQENRKQ